MTPDDRPEPPTCGDETATLNGFLDYQRATLAPKCSGLNDSQPRTRAVPPSNLSLLGLVRHMAEVERGWFREGIAQEDVDSIWCTAEHRDADFDDVNSANVSESFKSWQDEMSAARTVAAARSLDATMRHRTGEVMSLRWVLVHMVEEYARHNGHADLLRELVDGTTGE